MTIFFARTLHDLRTGVNGVALYRRFNIATSTIGVPNVFAYQAPARLGVRSERARPNGHDFEAHSGSAQQ